MAKLTQIQVKNFKKLQAQYTEIKKEYEQQRKLIVDSLLKNKSNFAHIDISLREIVNVNKLKFDGLYDNYSVFTEVKKLVLDI